MNSSVIHTRRIRHVIAALIAWLQRPAAFAAVAGCVSAVSLFAWLARASVVVGPSQFAQCGLILAAAIGLAWGSLRPNRRSATGSASAGWWLLAVTGWSVVLPWLLACPRWLIAHSSWSLLESPSIALLLGLAIGVVVLTLPTFAITRLLGALERWSDSWDQSGCSPGGDAHGWFAAGWLVSSLGGTQLASVIGGLDLLGALAVPVGCLSAGWAIYRAHLGKQIDSVEFGNTSPANRSTFGTLLGLIAAAIIGVAFVAIERMLFELTPAAYYLSAMAWTFLVCGRFLAFPKFSRLAALFRRGVGEFRWVNDRAVSSRLGGTLLLAALLLAFTAGWSGLIALGLTTNAFVSQVFWICALRMMAVGVVCGTLGLAWRQLGARPVGETETTLELARELALLLTAIAVTQTFLLPITGPIVLLAIAACGGLVIAGVTAFSGRQVPNTTGQTRSAVPMWRTRVGWVSVFAAVIAGCGGLSLYRPDASSRLLFSTTVFMARRVGVERSLLPYLDDSRLVETREGDQGTLTVWKQNGLQYQIRQRGIPIALKSLDPQVVPESSAETLWAALPLTLHEQPHRLLILGVAGGTGLQSCLAFPTQSLTCMEWDRGRAQLFRETLAPRLLPNPLDDSRLAFHTVDPIWALSANTALHDIILCDGGQPAELSSAPMFTREFYIQVSHALAPEGIYCQRFVHADLGPGPILTAVKTLQSAFREVITLQVSAGEMLLLATNSAEGLVRPKLLARAQRPHVRRVLAQVGWDWSVMFNLPACSDEKLRMLISDADQSIPINTAASGHFALDLPYEVMRWAPKWQEVQTTMASASQRLADWIPEEETTPLVDRLAEVTAQRELMSRYPDQPWVYRRTVKQRIQSGSSIIEQVKYEANGGMSPSSKRRLRYFATLGEAAKQPGLTPADIVPVIEFAEPYDPLISYFMQQEVAELYGRSTAAGSWDELRHRLHAIYFAPEHDRSVRNVVDAIELLVASPEAIPDPADRFDQLDSLLQVLKHRWENRGQASAATSRIVLNDVQKSIDAGVKGLTELGHLSADAGFRPDEWECRETVLRRGVIRPLRAYRNQLTAYHMRSEARTRQIVDDAAPASN